MTLRPSFFRRISGLPKAPGFTSGLTFRKASGFVAGDFYEL